MTGASSGIGEEFARQYAAKGHSLILVARSEDKLNQLAEELHQKHNVFVHVIPQDLAQLDSAEQVYNKCAALGVSVNVIVNNAGIGLIERFEEHELNKVQEMMILNMITLTKLTYLFLKQIKQTGGGILNVASEAGFHPSPYMAVYGGTKAYVLNFTNALRVELHETNNNVKVMALCPGPTYTKFFERANSSPNDINFKFRTPQEVVAEAISGFENNSSTTIPGWENKFFVFIAKLLPKPLISKLSRYNVNK